MLIIKRGGFTIDSSTYLKYKAEKSIDCTGSGGGVGGRLLEKKVTPT